MAKKEYGTRKKYHFIYKTTNLLSGRYYIGMHSTDDLNDGYLGSGTLLRRALNKYGKENFKIEFLEFVNSREELAAREKEIVSLQEIAKKECMNLKVGGEGGYSSDKHVENRQRARAEGHRKYFDSIKNDPDLYKEHGQKISRKKKGQKGTFKGKHHSEETKKKMSISKKSSTKGINNSQYGTCWITNEVESKKIYKGDLIPEGWRLGRKITGM